VRPEAQYFEFSMAASVQGWRTKWFYIKDHKSSPEDKYGLPPFDASQEVKKLASWDMLPSDAEVEQVLPLLSPIKALQGGQGVLCRVFNSWRFLYNVEFNPCSTALPSFGLTRAWKILLASLKI
jgi:hypothetical protein